ncbi:hypothetical protein [Microbacterium sp. NPDC089188]|uniref:hypothetical protein n=1 Tax=Microbacterium sp. NPDC089188 TaxID=3154971 RepID=UPI00344414DC
MTVVRTAVFPRVAAAVSELLGDYLRRTESEKAERGLATPGAALAARYAREIDDPAAAFAGNRVLVATVDDVDCGIVVVRISPRRRSILAVLDCAVRVVAACLAMTRCAYTSRSDPDSPTTRFFAVVSVAP